MSDALAGSSTARPVSKRYRGYAKSDLKMWEGILAEQAEEGENVDLSLARSEIPPMAATYTPSTATTSTKHSTLTSTVSSSALLGSSSTKLAGNSAWKRGVADRNVLPTSPPLSPSSSIGPSSPKNAGHSVSDFQEETLMTTLMPSGAQPFQRNPHSLLQSQSTLRPSKSPDSDIFYDDDDDDDDDFTDVDDPEYMEDSLVDPSSSYSSAPTPSAAPSSPNTNNRTVSPSRSLPGSFKSFLGPPPTAPAISPPLTRSSMTSTAGSQSSDTSDNQVAITPSTLAEPSNPPIQPVSTKMTASRRNRSRTRNSAHRLTYVGTEEELGILRRSELARLAIPHFRKDYQVSILIQYTDNSKDVLEYKNRVHPECLGSDIINECVTKTKKKLPNWSPPADKFTAFELIIPAKADEDDDVVMDLETPIWKYCFVPGEVTRLVFRLKMRFDSSRIALKIRTDRGPLRTMMFHNITTISMVIEKIQHKIKTAEKKGPPFTGLFVFDNKRGRFLENVNKTLADYGVKQMDIVQVKRRRLMELCLKEHPNRNVMLPLDLTASGLAEQLHDWLRLDPVDSSLLSIVKIVPQRGTTKEMQLVLNPTTEIRDFHLSKDDTLQLRKKVAKLDAKSLTTAAPGTTKTDWQPHSSPRNATNTHAASSSSSTPSTQAPTVSPSSTPTTESRLAKSGTVQTFSHTTDVPSPNDLSSTGPPIPASHHASMRLTPLTPLTNSSPAAPSSSSSADPLASRSQLSGTMGAVVATFRVAFSGNTHDSESFGSGISVQDAIFRGGTTRRFPPPKLKVGEVGLFQTVYGINMWDSSLRESRLGDVHITNYRLVFSSFCEDTMSDYLVDVPLTTISRVEKTGDKSKLGLKVDCKDFRTLRFQFDRNGKESRRQLRRLLEDCLYPNFKQLFALAYKSSKPANASKPNGWKILNLPEEFKRLGVGEKGCGSRWRISSLNDTYAFSKTYPSIIAVPASVSDDELVPVFKYRSKGRLPALSWLNARTGASITRCSQPLSGMTKKTSLDDANLINAIKEAQGSADAKLHLLDARPRANAIANMAMGGGFEVLSGSAYSGCDLEFLNIGNIHVMRNSLSDLKSLIESQPYDNSFLSRLEASGWLLHISLILQGANKIVEHIQARHSCVLHCSDGWDRTSQLSSVAMLLLDPYYRTLHGFCILIEKEWCSFGHKFASRYGHIAIDHVDKNYAHGERAPIFVQFMDCVYQIIRQFPLAFEFTETLLLFLLEHLYSCHYGTFLFDCERERKAANVSTKTESIWTYVLDSDNHGKFTNVFYEPFDSVLPLAPTLADIQIWRAYYRRWYAPPDEDKATMNEKIRTLVTSHTRQADRIAQLELRLSALEKSRSLDK